MYYKKFNGKKRDLLLLTGDIQPIDEESCYTFCEEIIKITKQFQCTEMITTGGIGLSYIPEKPKVYCTGNEKKLFQEYVKKGMLIEKDIFGVVGPIIGVSGVLLGLGKKRKVPGVALLAETFGNPIYLGVKGAQEILQVLEKKFHYGFDIKKMSKDFTALEAELAGKTQEWMNEVAAVQQAGAQAKKKDFNYIG